MQNPKVIIHWKDISTLSASGGWGTLDEMKKDAADCYALDYTTIGELIFDGPDYIIVASTSDNDEDDPNYNDASMIMKSVITKIEKLNV